ncbi:hypothetical protein HYH02_005214 [Chlamydomonas schloesseri]|uniref:SRCR domain-containing protein n=1 Tax=Chlamydomonas schloesseri TaxID=2026947 RepID=A0A835WN25_9CHLO|nr:hypothetical protein HYH02_005214 [Chlamydomonas schloesseri]|eukprot:KAG2449685.1 hypothetical protein HYH02_005214 [Chlamydomonas schloesseri]
MFGRADARVACRDLGLPFKAARSYRADQGSSGGAAQPTAAAGGTQPMWLDNVACSGNEARLRDCRSNGWGVSACPEAWRVGVVCTDVGEAEGHAAPGHPVSSSATIGGAASVQDGSLRLLPDYPSEPAGDATASEYGVVQVAYDGVWGTIGVEGFDEADAKTICRQLGFAECGSEGGAHLTAALVAAGVTRTATAKPAVGNEANAASIFVAAVRCRPEDYSPPPSPPAYSPPCSASAGDSGCLGGGPVGAQQLGGGTNGTLDAGAAVPAGEGPGPGPGPAGSNPTSGGDNQPSLGGGLFGHHRRRQRRQLQQGLVLPGGRGSGPGGGGSGGRGLAAPSGSGGGPPVSGPGGQQPAQAGPTAARAPPPPPPPHPAPPSPRRPPPPGRSPASGRAAGPGPAPVRAGPAAGGPVGPGPGPALAPSTAGGSGGPSDAGSSGAVGPVLQQAATPPAPMPPSPAGGGSSGNVEDADVAACVAAKRQLEAEAAAVAAAGGTQASGINTLVSCSLKLQLKTPAAAGGAGGGSGGGMAAALHCSTDDGSTPTIQVGWRLLDALTSGQDGAEPRHSGVRLALRSGCGANVTDWGASLTGVGGLTLHNSTLRDVPLSASGALLQCTGCGAVRLTDLVIANLTGPTAASASQAAAVSGGGGGGAEGAWRTWADYGCSALPAAAVYGAVMLADVEAVALERVTCSGVRQAHGWACLLVAAVPSSNTSRVVSLAVANTTVRGNSVVAGGRLYGTAWLRGAADLYVPQLGNSSRTGSGGSSSSSSSSSGSSGGGSTCTGGSLTRTVEMMQWATPFPGPLAAVAAAYGITAGAAGGGGAGDVPLTSSADTGMYSGDVVNGYQFGQDGDNATSSYTFGYGAIVLTLMRQGGTGAGGAAGPGSGGGSSASTTTTTTTTAGDGGGGAGVDGVAAAAAGGGGAVEAPRLRYAISLSRSTFAFNYGGRGAALGTTEEQGIVTRLEVSDCVLLGNVAWGEGGALFLSPAAYKGSSGESTSPLSYTFARTSLHASVALTGAGGALSAWAPGALQLADGSSAVGNVAGRGSGGVAVLPADKGTLCASSGTSGGRTLRYSVSGASRLRGNVAAGDGGCWRCRGPRTPATRRSCTSWWMDSSSSAVGNAAGLQGGVLRLGGGGVALALRLADAGFAQNTAGGSGGAISADGGVKSAAVSGCVVLGNRAGISGGFLDLATTAVSGSSGSSTDSSSVGVGGAAFDTFSFEDSVVAQNVAAGGDGGVFVLPTSRLGRQHLLSGCSFTGNSAAGRGGVGAWNWLSLPVTVLSCNMTANSGTQGGGALSFDGYTSEGFAVTVANSNLEGNAVLEGDGGALLLTPTVRLSTYRSQKVPAAGQQQQHGGAVSVTLTRSSLDHNSAKRGSGGALYWRTVVVADMSSGTSSSSSSSSSSASNASSSSSSSSASASGAQLSLNLRLLGVSMAHNGAGGAGGAVYLRGPRESAALRLVLAGGTTLRRNRAGDGDTAIGQSFRAGGAVFMASTLDSLATGSSTSSEPDVATVAAGALGSCELAVTSGSVVAANSVGQGMGGGLAVVSCRVLVADSRLSDNVADQEGGALAVAEEHMVRAPDAVEHGGSGSGSDDCNSTVSAAANDSSRRRRLGRLTVPAPDGRQPAQQLLVLRRRRRLAASAAADEAGAPPPWEEAAPPPPPSGALGTSGTSSSSSNSSGGGTSASSPLTGVEIRKSCVRGNRAGADGGGGVYLEALAPLLVLRDARFEDNSAGGTGGSGGAVLVVQLNQQVADMYGGGGNASLTSAAASFQQRRMAARRQLRLWRSGDGGRVDSVEQGVQEQVGLGGAGPAVPEGNNSERKRRSRRLQQEASSLAAGSGGGGGGLVPTVNVSITNASFTGNTAQGNGGALELQLEAGFVLVRGSAFARNTAASQGGAVRVYARGLRPSPDADAAAAAAAAAAGAGLNSTSDLSGLLAAAAAAQAQRLRRRCAVELVDSRFEGNAADEGGAVLVSLPDLKSMRPVVRLTRCALTNNSALLGRGGGLALSVLWSDSPLWRRLQQQQQQQQAGPAPAPAGPFAAVGSEPAGSTSSTLGEFTRAGPAVLEVRGCDASGNTASVAGGAVHVGVLCGSGLAAAACVAQAAPDAVSMTPVLVSVTGCNLHHNNAQFGGGAIAVVADVAARVSITRTDIHSNAVASGPPRGGDSGSTGATSSSTSSTASTTAGTSSSSSSSSSSQNALTFNNRPTLKSTEIPAPATSTPSYATSSSGGGGGSGAGSGGSSAAAASDDIGTGWGGGVYVSGAAAVSLVDTNVTRNHVQYTAAASGGGGVFVGTDTSLSLRGVRLLGNSAGGSGSGGGGGGVMGVSCGHVDMLGSSVAGCSARNGRGGGLLLRDCRSVALLMCDVVCNSASVGGGAAFVVGSGSEALTAPAATATGASAAATASAGGRKPLGPMMALVYGTQLLNNSARTVAASSSSTSSSGGGGSGLSSSGSSSGGVTSGQGGGLFLSSGVAAAVLASNLAHGNSASFSGAAVASTQECRNASVLSKDASSLLLQQQQQQQQQQQGSLAAPASWAGGATASSAASGVAMMSPAAAAFGRTWALLRAAAEGRCWLLAVSGTWLPTTNGTAGAAAGGPGPPSAFASQDASASALALSCAPPLMVRAVWASGAFVNLTQQGLDPPPRADAGGQQTANSNATPGGQPQRAAAALPAPLTTGPGGRAAQERGLGSAVNSTLLSQGARAMLLQSLAECEFATQQQEADTAAAAAAGGLQLEGGSSGSSSRLADEATIGSSYLALPASAVKLARLQAVADAAYDGTGSSSTSGGSSKQPLTLTLRPGTYYTLEAQLVNGLQQRVLSSAYSVSLSVVAHLPALEQAAAATAAAATASAADSNATAGVMAAGTGGTGDNSSSSSSSSSSSWAAGGVAALRPDSYALLESRALTVTAQQGVATWDQVSIRAWPGRYALILTAYDNRFGASATPLAEQRVLVAVTGCRLGEVLNTDMSRPNTPFWTSCTACKQSQYSLWRDARPPLEVLLGLARPPPAGRSGSGASAAAGPPSPVSQPPLPAPAGGGAAPGGASWSPLSADQQVLMSAYKQVAAARPDSVCRNCPQNAECPGGAVIVPLAGYWHSAPNSTKVHRCPQSDACSGSSSDGVTVASAPAVIASAAPGSAPTPNATAGADNTAGPSAAAADVGGGDSSSSAAASGILADAPDDTRAANLVACQQAWYAALSSSLNQDQLSLSAAAGNNSTAALAAPAVAAGGNGGGGGGGAGVAAAGWAAALDCQLWGLPRYAPANYMQQQCAEGYTGQLCASCQPGYYLNLDFECNQCNSFERNLAIGILQFLGTVALCLWTIWANLREGAAACVPQREQEQEQEQVDAVTAKESSRATSFGCTPSGVGCSRRSGASGGGAGAGLLARAESPPKWGLNSGAGGASWGARDVGAGAAGGGGTQSRAHDLTADEGDDEHIGISEVLKTGIVHIQIFVTVTRLNLNWPALIGKFQGILRSASGAENTIAYSPSCLFSGADGAQQARIEVFASLLQPIFVIAVVLVLWWCRWLLTKHVRKRVAQLLLYTARVVTMRRFRGSFGLPPVALEHDPGGHHSHTGGGPAPGLLMSQHPGLGLVARDAGLPATPQAHTDGGGSNDVAGAGDDGPDCADGSAGAGGAVADSSAAMPRGAAAPGAAQQTPPPPQLAGQQSPDATFRATASRAGGSSSLSGATAATNASASAYSAAAASPAIVTTSAGSHSRSHDITGGDSSREAYQPVDAAAAGTTTTHSPAAGGDVGSDPSVLRLSDNALGLPPPKEFKPALLTAKHRPRSPLTPTSAAVAPTTPGPVCEGTHPHAALDTAADSPNPGAADASAGAAAALARGSPAAVSMAAVADDSGAPHRYHHAAGAEQPSSVARPRRRVTVLRHAIRSMATKLPSMARRQLHSARSTLYSLDDMASLRQQTFVAVTVAVFILYSSWAQASLSIFACYLIDDRAGDYPEMQQSTWPRGYWVRQIDQECYTGVHAALYLPLGIAFVIVVCAAPPLASAIIMVRRRHRLAEPKTKVVYGFLYDRYKPRFFWWESMVQLELLVLVAVDVFGRGLPVFQQAVLMLIAVNAVAAINIACSPLRHALMVKGCRGPLRGVKRLFGVSAVARPVEGLHEATVEIGEVVLGSATVFTGDKGGRPPVRGVWVTLGRLGDVGSLRFRRDCSSTPVGFVICV